MSGINGTEQLLPDQAGYPTWVLNAFSVSTTANKCMVELRNASPTNRVFIHSFEAVNEQTSAVTGVVAQFVIGRALSTATASIALTPVSFDTNNPALPLAVSASTGGSIVIVDTFNRLTVSTDEWAANSADAESIVTPQMKVLNLLPQLAGARPIVLNQGQSLAVNCPTNTGTGLFTFRIVFSIGA